MDPIYGRIAANKRKTFLLFILYAVLFAIIGYFGGIYIGDPVIGFILAFLVFIVLFLVSYFGGQGVVTSMAGAREVSKKDEPFLYNTVEALSIAAGKPVPKLYIIESEVPNAFAAGRNPQNSIIAVTRGLLKRLNRQELEGVIAHEMAHINNYDVLLATVAVVLAGTIVFLGVVVRRSALFGGLGRGGRRSGQGQLIGILVLVIIGILAPVFAQLLRFAISRQREYLADATAADFTGYPEGLASALEKITNMQVPNNRLENSALNGLYIVNPALGLKAANRMSVLFSTHPPAEDRIKRLRAM
ncbi:MAG: M48 family metallopeptidase [Bacillota bacterium]|nr:M48 family metallopeptidase [Bacillota bacterium]